MLHTYFPVLLLLGFVIANAVLMLGLSHLTLRPRPTPVKQTPVRVGHSAARRRARALLREVLHGGGAVHHLRHRNGVHDPVGRVLPAAVVRGAARQRRVPGRAAVALRPVGDARVHRRSSSWDSSTCGRRERCNGIEPDVPIAPATSSETTGNEPWITTRLDFVNWGRKNSLWPMPFGTACCAIEFMATAASKYDLARFGMERRRSRRARPTCSSAPAACRSSSRRCCAASGSRCRSPSGASRWARARRAAACSTTTPWCRASTASFRSTSTCPAARRVRKGCSTAS